jgi:lipopolysaccharide transport system ATP-binding protein
MSRPIIEVRQVSKAYRLGTIGATSLKEEVARLWHRARHPESNGRGSAAKEFWAIHDVTFDVQPGEVVGIIGRNGAGKSTLLKILSRITQATSGEITLRGRVASLLEVGTGFHPDLTGRENIFLNGAILGMRKAEMHRKFDEIVAFAEVEQFIDTPVKRYSSGMYVRLAFAVAAHLEPEILIVDEVLAVGDIAFQNKCLGKMSMAARQGRTILFVSHNLAAVQNLCQRALLIDGGTIVADGATESILRRYVSESSSAAHLPLADRLDREGTGIVRISSIHLEDGNGATVKALRCGEAARIVLHYQNLAGRNLRNVRIDVGIDDAGGQRIALLSSDLTSQGPFDVRSDVNAIEVRVDRLPLIPGKYTYTLFFAINGEPADWIQNAGCFDVEAGDFFHTGRLPSDVHGRFYIDHQFSAVATAVPAFREGEAIVNDGRGSIRVSAEGRGL